MATTFELLNEDVRKAIWEMGWERFRPIQDEAIRVVTGSENDLIISAPTASGKTEAAFLPLISRHSEALHKGLAILYISPLKALINDQFGRISRLCKEMDIPITRWHGDAEWSRKQRLLKKPRGILLITPESLEALLIRREVEARALLGGVKALVIDEIHYFLEGERGSQLYSLLKRVEKLTEKEHLRRIALSATLGEGGSVKEWLSSTPAEVKLVEDKNDSTKDTMGNIISVITTEESPERFEKELYRLTSTGKSLIFSNKKSSLENYCDRMKKYMEKRRLPDIYRIHHGSLGKESREETERELKESPNLSVFCTSTLELGIDIGDIDLVILLAPPWRVSSFIQRIGRSGRQAGKPIRFAFLYEHRKENMSNSLQVALVKSIALVELYLEGYCEPYSFNRQSYSCLIHQLLAYLAQRGGVKADELYQVIVKDSFRESLTIEEYINILKHLKELEYIEQFANGEIVPAAKGERLVESYKFYAVFKTPENWQVLCNGELIGEIPFLIYYREGDQMVLGGKRWEIKRIEKEQKRVLVSPSRGKKDIIYEGLPTPTSRKIHHKMREIYEEKRVPLYLDETTESLLRGAYSYYEELCKREDILFHFEGGRIANTIGMLIKGAGIESDDFEIGLELKKTDKRGLFSILDHINLTPAEFERAAADICTEDKLINKYDELLPLEFLDRSYLQTLCDVEGTISFLKEREKKGGF